MKRKRDTENDKEVKVSVEEENAKGGKKGGFILRGKEVKKGGEKEG